MSELESLIEVSNKILDRLNGKSNDDEVINEECFGMYDPDSSPVAWEYYAKIYYFVNNNMELGIKKIKNRNLGIYVIREIGTFEYKEDRKKGIEQKNFKNPPLTLGKEINLAGDCVFNFNENKVHRFREKICAGCDNLNNETTLEIFEKCKECKQLKKIVKLKWCNAKHHSPYNFALMPVTGGMNNSKVGLDRTDTLLYGIKKFYDEKPKNDLVEKYKKRKKK